VCCAGIACHLPLSAASLLSTLTVVSSCSQLWDRDLCMFRHRRIKVSWDSIHTWHHNAFSTKELRNGRTSYLHAIRNWEAYVVVGKSVTNQFLHFTRNRVRLYTQTVYLHVDEKCYA
jgi:hypothetical protein